MRWTPQVEELRDRLRGPRHRRPRGRPLGRDRAVDRRAHAGARPLPDRRRRGRPRHRAVGPRHRRLPQRTAVEPRAADAAGRPDPAAARRRRSSTRSARTTALRSVTILRDRFMLNGRPYTLRMVLDQGYWPDTLMTAPGDEGLRRDVELAKAMGFNGVRKHQKIEDPRYLYWADRLGLLVWEEMPSAYRFTRTAIRRTVREWTEAIERDYSHPCVIVWVPFNESWGVPELTAVRTQRHAVEALYHLTKTLDATRPVIGNDGWESSATDIIGIHDYDANREHLRQRYGTETKPEQLFDRRRPGGRILTLDGYPHRGQPIMLTEFGGIAFIKYPQDGVPQTWGYTVARTDEDFAQMYADLLHTVIHTVLFAGFCYTQFADTFQEANGLLSADRRPKLPIEDIARITRESRTHIPGGV
ncbi:MAG: hypothetical protein MZW92_30040 [Comamonadaceae bacterium]|nr:hypothetical protein [Comamonadaceae bacterium]